MELRVVEMQLNKKFMNNTTIRVIFISEASRDSFFEYVNGCGYRFIYNNWQNAARKELSKVGNPRGNCELYLEKQSVLDQDKLNRDILIYGGRIGR